MNYDNQKNAVMLEAEALASFYNCTQDKSESPEDYMHKLKAWANVVKHCGGRVSGNWKNTTATSLATIQETATNQTPREQH